MTGVGFFAAKEAAVTSGPDSYPPPRVTDSDGGGRAGSTLHSAAFNLLTAAPRRLWRSQPSAREGVWVNTAQPPDDPETSWPSTVFNPFGSETGEMVVPTGPPTDDLGQLPETDAGYGCLNSPAQPERHRRLMAWRSRGKHAAPSVGIGSRLARKFAASR